MRRVAPLVLLAAITVLTSSAAAQGGEALLRKAGAPTPVPNPSFVAARDVEYKVVWDITGAPATPGEMAPGIARPANFLMIAEANGVARARVHLAIIVSGGATAAVLTNEAYHAVAGVDNPNVALLQAMADAGVRVIVCGQALAGKKYTRDQVLPFVQVATSATFARATLHAEGYATFSP